MKTVDIIILLIAVGWLIYMGNPKITCYPFSFSMVDWKLTISIFLFMASIFFYSLHYFEKGRLEAYDEIMEYIEEARKNETTNEK